MGLRNILRGKRRVESGSFPLYRLLAVCSMISSLLQILYGAPASVSNTTNPMFDWIFVCLQLLGTFLIVFSLYFHKMDLDDSLRLEQIGCLILLTSMASYTSAITINNGIPPFSQGSWLIIAFALYMQYRVREIQKIIRSLYGKGKE